MAYLDLSFLSANILEYLFIRSGYLILSLCLIIISRRVVGSHYFMFMVCIHELGKKTNARNVQKH